MKLRSLDDFGVAVSRHTDYATKWEEGYNYIGNTNVRWDPSTRWFAAASMSTGSNSTNPSECAIILVLASPEPSMYKPVDHFNTVAGVRSFKSKNSGMGATRRLTLLAVEFPDAERAQKVLDSVQSLVPGCASGKIVGPKNDGSLGPFSVALRSPALAGTTSLLVTNDEGQVQARRIDVFRAGNLLVRVNGESEGAIDEQPDGMLKISPTAYQDYLVKGLSAVLASMG